MEGSNQVDSSSSSPSFTSELFGSKDSSSSAGGTFGSIFGPPSKAVGREILKTENEQKIEYSSEGWNNKTDEKAMSTEPENEKKQSNRDMNSVFHDQRVQPCHLSSSIYYGGQENYSHPQNQNQGSEYNSTYKKDSCEDDSGSASRGNWWQGSLYY